MTPTRSQVLNGVLESLVVGIQNILAENFLGAYLGGSFAHGGWDQDSDVDFAVVVVCDLTPRELAELEVHHAQIFNLGSYWARHLEGAYFPVDILSDLDRTDILLWYLDNGSLTFERSLHDNTLVNRWVLREHGVILAGPDPKIWIPSIPEDRLRAEVRQTMILWGNEILTGMYSLENRWAQTFAVLMYCRMAHTLTTGRVESKPAGADWAKETLDPVWKDLIEDALHARPDQYQKISLPSDPEKVRLTKAFIVSTLDRFG
jgi:predicted nucleotidyltransferase